MVLSHAAWPGPCTPAPCPHKAGPQVPASHLWTLQDQITNFPQPGCKLLSRDQAQQLLHQLFSTGHSDPPAELASGPLHWLFLVPFAVPTLPPSPLQVSAVCLMQCQQPSTAPTSPTSLSALFLLGAVPPTTAIDSVVFVCKCSVAPTGILACRSYFCIPGAQQALHKCQRNGTSSLGSWETERDSTARAPCSLQGPWLLPEQNLSSGPEESHSRESQQRGPALSPGRPQQSQRASRSAWPSGSVPVPCPCRCSRGAQGHPEAACAHACVPGARAQCVRVWRRRGRRMCV